MGASSSRSSVDRHDVHTHDEADDVEESPHLPFTLEQYLAVIQTCSIDSDFFLHPSDGVNETDYEFDLITYSSTASALLKSSDSLSAWRYRLVPSKINEFTFWKNTFQQLDWLIQQHQQHPDHDASSTPETLPSSAHEDDEDSIFTTDDLTNHAGHDGIEGLAQIDSSSGSVYESHDGSHSSDRVKQLEAQVARLQAEIASLQAQLSHPAPACVRCKQSVERAERSSVCHYHPGTWQPDQGTLNFLSLDDELKANLRREKEKRLNAVKYEMRWICDTNDAMSGAGTWTCCKKESSQAEGCSQSTHSLPAE